MKTDEPKSCMRNLAFLYPHKEIILQRCLKYAEIVSINSSFVNSKAK